MDLEKGALGNAIRKGRMLRGLSYEALADLVNITPTHLKHIESEHRKPSVEVLFRLVSVLHISLDALLFSGGVQESDEFQGVLSLLAGCSKGELAVVSDMICSLQRNRAEKNA